MQEHHDSLLKFSDALITSINLPDHHRAALGVATQRLLQLPTHASSAFQLTLAIGQCCILNQALQQQLLNLASKQALVHVLIAGLSLANATDDTAAAATVVRAIKRLVVLHQLPKAVPLSCQLAGVWTNLQQRKDLLHAACGSPAAAHAVAALAVHAAWHQGLPAAWLFKDAFRPPHDQTTHLEEAAAASYCSKKAWAAVGLQPMLLHIQSQLQSHFPLCVTASFSDQLWQPQQQQHGLLEYAGRSGFQQLWLLLCAAIGAADGMLLDSHVLQILSSMAADPHVVCAMQIALLAPLQPALTKPATGLIAECSCTVMPGTSPSTSGSSSSNCAGIAAPATAAAHADSRSSRSQTQCCTSYCSSPQSLHAPTLQLIEHLATQSVGLARQCFKTLSPIIPYALVAATDSAACPTAPFTGPQAAAAGRSAVLRVWQQLLQKGRTCFKSSMVDLSTKVLPTVVEALAAAAAAVSEAAAVTADTQDGGQEQQQQHPRQQQQLGCNDVLRHADAVAAAFVTLAGSTEGPNQLLQPDRDPVLLLNTLTPHVSAFVVLLQVGTSSVVLNTTAAAADSSSSTCCTAGDGVHRVSHSVLLLALQLLQCWAAAVQQLLQQQQQQPQLSHNITAQSGGQHADHTASSLSLKQAVAVLDPLLPVLVSHLASLLSAGSVDGLQARCQTAGLELALALLGCSRTCRRGGPQHTPGSPSAAHTSTSSSTDVLQHGSSSGGDAAAAAAGSGDSSGGGVAVPWLELVVALVVVFKCHPQDPMNLAQRQLLQTACHLLLDLAPHLSQHDQQPHSSLHRSAQQEGTSLNTTACSTAAVHPGTAVGSVGQSGPGEQHVQPEGCDCQQQQVVWGGLRAAVEVLRSDVAARKLARSSSRDELLQALVGVLELLQQLQFV